ncbi:MAG: family metallopeptidase [Mucilaginibacter sp.]|uniref:M13 family metallopeptidase n=1 Tax=Mucilaginibacter sp. TaxID=1882438 RepID=UPI002639E24E|nr:M13 family metallopeptidase [Mucilaginibacter sp.]MDB5002439.1 family metallopeptidase [Mucilaginibacter sp.]
MKIKLSRLIVGSAICITASAFVIDNIKPKPKMKFIDPENMDKSIKPGDDFYEYANGAWIKKHPIPAKETRWGAFNILAQENTDHLVGLLKDAGKKPGLKGSVTQRVGDMYTAGMDTLTIEKRGYEPIKADLERIARIKTTDDVVTEATYERTHAIAGPLFAFGVGPDSKHPNVNIVSFYQGGTTLPDRDYYLKDDARTLKIQNAYKQYIVNLFTFSGTDTKQAVKNADIIFGIETKLAKAQLSRTELRDPNRSYHKFSVIDFQKTTPHFKWVKLMVDMKAPGQDSIIVGQPDFFKTTDDLVGSTTVDDLKTYLSWGILKGAAGSLSSPFVKASFDFTSVLTGQKVQTPRKERMASLIDGSMGELLGQLYVEKYFKPAAKTYMINLVNNLKSVLGDRIKRVEWMSDETKAKALKKLAAFSVKIGYTDKWEEYKGLVIERDDYFGNLKRIGQWRYNFNVSQLGKPVDKKRFNMTPPTVNANYSPTKNEITFPAGILQFPFFDFAADDAVNYGAIGAVIGHEMTHGFDDQGRQYDADGSLHDWWTKADADKFKSRADRVVEQFNGYTVNDTIHINGRLTLGENLADLGGINVAYEAFKKTKQGKSNVKIDGFTPDQRFFLSFAQVWRGLARPETSAQLVLTDPHSPGQYRAFAALTNIDAWYKAFNVQPGDKLYKKPEDRIKVW